MVKFRAAAGGRRWGLALAALWLWGGVGAARGDLTLWYNGDFNANSMTVAPNGLVNESTTGPPTTYSAVYDDFVVPAGQTWSITGVFSNDLLGTTVSSAYWEIRSGVSSGDGGQLLYSGTDAATLTPTGRSFGLDEYTVAVSDLSGITLGAGTYWLSVTPIDSQDGSSYITNTDGTNSINVQAGTSDNTFITSTDAAAFPSGLPYFEPAHDYIGSPADFSMGVTGTLITTTPVPEPASSSIVVGTLALLAAVCGLGRLPRPGREPA